MKIVTGSGVYAFILAEDEWYSATEQQREAWIAQIMREGEAAKCLYLNIAVKPDEVMSISPVPRQHTVWRHTFPTSAEDAFRAELLEARNTWAQQLSYATMRTIARQVFEL